MSEPDVVHVGPARPHAEVRRQIEMRIQTRCGISSSPLEVVVGVPIRIHEPSVEEAVIPAPE
ncbi:hypothetical protein ES703_111891 [subsurface metagenome]